jgi:hypothetical protein
MKRGPRFSATARGLSFASSLMNRHVLAHEQAIDRLMAHECVVERLLRPHPQGTDAAVVLPSRY